MQIQDPPISLAVKRAGRELALETGEKMAGYVTRGLLRTLLEVAREAEAAGVKKESAVACYIRLCGAACEDIFGPADTGGGTDREFSSAN